MSERLVVYKTAIQRVTETALVLLVTFGVGMLWHDVEPQISTTYLILPLLLIGFAVIPRLGTSWAERTGAPMMSADERNRRYLAELGPIGLRPARPTARHSRRG